MGVETRQIFRLKKFAVRRVARVTGQPSAPADIGILSISSINTILIGLEANPAGLFDPAIESLAPFRNAFCVIVLSPSFAFGSPICSRIAGVELINGASLSWDHARAISRVGCKTSIGLGSWTMKNPQMLLMISVLPHWLAIMQTTRCTRGSLNASMIPRWYSARFVCHRPGNGELSRLRIRSASAH